MLGEGSVDDLIWTWILEAVEFGGGSGGAFVFAFAGLEIVDNVERYASAVVALALVDKYSVGMHRPVVVGCIEDVGSRQLYR